MVSNKLELSSIRYTCCRIWLALVFGSGRTEVQFPGTGWDRDPRDWWVLSTHPTPRKRAGL